MTAIGASGVDGDNVPANLLDNNVSTAWSGSNNDIVWVAIDLGGVHRINWFELVGNSKDRDGQPVALMVFDSKEPVADMSQAHYLGKFEYNPEHIYNHAYKLENPIDTRFILIAFPSVQRVSITEFCAYYADAATHYAKESELELQPDPDDDPTYYPEIEYMIPLDGQNSLTFEATNPDDPSEYTFKTTGGDPFVRLAPLKKAAAGTVLVFQYKASADLACEFFWCKKGTDPAGGKETFFNLKRQTNGRHSRLTWLVHGITVGGMEKKETESVSTSVMEEETRLLSDLCTGVPPRKANKPSSLTL